MRRIDPIRSSLLLLLCCLALAGCSTPKGAADSPVTLPNGTVIPAGSDALTRERLIQQDTRLGQERRHAQQQEASVARQRELRQAEIDAIEIARARQLLMRAEQRRRESQQERSLQMLSQSEQACAATERARERHWRTRQGCRWGYRAPGGTKDAGLLMVSYLGYRQGVHQWMMRYSDNTATFVQCSRACDVVRERLYNAGRIVSDQTIRPIRGSITWQVIQDIRSGAVAPDPGEGCRMWMDEQGLLICRDAPPSSG